MHANYMGGLTTKSDLFKTTLGWISNETTILLLFCAVPFHQNIQTYIITITVGD